MRTQVPESNKTSENERKKNAPRGTRFMSAYSCRLDVGHEIHHYTEQITGIHISVKRNYARFYRESPSARYGIQGLNPGRNLSSQIQEFVADLKKILSRGRQRTFFILHPVLSSVSKVNLTWKRAKTGLQVRLSNRRRVSNQIEVYIISQIV